MASLRARVSWAPNGYLRYQSFPKQPIFCKPQQEIIKSSRRRLSVAAAKLACRGGSTNTTSNNNSSAGFIDLPTMKKKTDSVEDDQYSNKLDQWMTDSVVEIVRNIGEAPLLLLIYSGNERHDCSSNASAKLVIEKAVADNWPIIQGGWKGGSPIPNGVILVEELESKEVVNAGEDENRSDRCTSSKLHHSCKTWGVLVQAKGLNRTACYILKTCRVQTLFGFCTHFCLDRVSCFVESAETQLKKMWLVR